jgi:threonine/homoserine/homoserine lactone efflux protein
LLRLALRARKRSASSTIAPAPSGRKRSFNLVVPITLGLVFLLLFMSTRSLIETSIVLLAVPFSLIGAFWLIYHVFECPMAKGYKRWVQPTDELENPYMGQEMLTCGSEVTGD